MQTLFCALDTLLDLPFPAFLKKLTKFEEEFRSISISDVSEEELESYFTRIQKEYGKSTGDGAKTRLATLGYLSHFDTLVEKFFPDYVMLFQETLDREDTKELAGVNYGFLEHMDEILREYTHRLSEPDQYPSYTGFIQELVQNSMIDLFFWLQEREATQEKKAAPLGKGRSDKTCLPAGRFTPSNEEGKISGGDGKEGTNVGGFASDRNTELAIRPSSETKNPELKMTRECLELLGEGVLEKIFFDHEYPLRVSPIDPELPLIGRYERKKEAAR